MADENWLKNSRGLLVKLGLNRGWLVVSAGYVLLVMSYGLLNPLFEAPDEHNHYFVVESMARSGRMPIIDPINPDEWLAQEAAQPPLYYWLGSWLIRAIDIDTTQSRQQVWPNPFVRLGDAGAAGNRNAFVHGPWESWPWQGYVLAAHLLRLFSSFIGLGTLAAVYGCGRLLWPAAPQRATLAMALVAFLPQFLFLHSAITNDGLVIFFCSLALWQLVWLWQRQEVGAGRWIGLGLTIGLAILSKTAGLALLAYVGLVLWLRPGSFRQKLTTICLVVVPAGLVAGWLLWRNWTLYGDPTATNQFILFEGASRLTPWQIFSQNSGLWKSFIAVFGWFNVSAPTGIYLLWAGLACLALLGGWRLPEKATFPAGLFALWWLVVYAGLVSFMLRTPAGQGRLLFPAIAPIALGLAYGLSHWRWAMRLAPWLALFSSCYCLLVVIRPTYAPPPTVRNVPAGANPVIFDQGLTLLAATLEQEVVRPGQTLWLTLYWQATTPLPLRPAPELVVELFGRQLALVGKWQGYHGGGLYPAGLWPAGAIIADRVGIELQPEIESPTQLQIQVRLAEGQQVTTVGFVKVAPPVTRPSQPPIAQFGDGLTLTDLDLSHEMARPGQTITLTLQWHVLAAPGRDYTTFIHLGDPTQLPLATGDSPPLHGDYPTHWWAASETIRADSYSLHLPPELSPGRYPLWLGLYDPLSGQRLPLTIAGQRQADDAFPAGTIEILPP